MLLRTIVLWLALIVLFVVFYNSFAAGAGGGAPAEAGWARLLPLAVVVLGVLGIFGWLFASGRRWADANNRGIAYLNAGDSEEAGRQFLVASKKALNKLQRAISELNLGICHMQSGRLADASALLRKVDASGGLRAMRVYHRALPHHLATCYALLGDVAAARSMLEEGERRRGKDPAGFSVLPEAVILCREDHFGAAVKALDSRWREVEMAGGVYQKMSRLVRGLALDALDPVGNAQAVMEALAGAKPLAPSDIQALTVSWPRMREFLVAQKLLAAA